MDSRVAHHFTLDISMIQNTAPFIANEQVMVGNGKKIPIFHYGHSLLSFYFSPLKLNNILHALAFSNNILSVSDFVLITLHLWNFILTSFLRKIRS